VVLAVVVIDGMLADVVTVTLGRLGRSGSGA
jgi:hypothetical protein